ncbi:SNF2 family DNA or RNA helicase [Actinoplanes lutulentus]|uniref:SNF2 family DNA or RNA helicase n=1 Tax=Actinoplanes lutulentus TaxID=1287878 RepID=A0A327Z655_9ACTN|nr:DEAD/DEAH box helicase [Actinoplanes lutulentus]MBB2945033.1 SNF2 family DNA or RNA helicase [Actinoplanes lutulentus]RAK31828.1 SNF2 family DNA or RNA helicase [Actinoplanes lutulentus]
MLVVHGGWVPGAGGPGRLVLWAEDPAMPLTSASRARSRPHPFAVSADMLRAALGEPVVDAAGETATVSLPGTAQGPLPSPEAAAAAAIDTEAGRPPRGLRLAAWAIPVLTVPAEAATPVLATLAEPDPGGSWVAGPSLRYLCLLAGYACDLARRGRMLPQLVVEAGVPAARWRPVLTGADAVTFRDFATGIPPVARAIVTSASGKPAPGNPGAGKPGADQTAGHPAGRIVRETLEALVDVAARDVMPERILAGMRPGPKAPLPDRWLSALTTDDPALPGAPSGEVRELRQALDDWMRAANAANGPIRVSFRLIEPGVESDEWALEFALQSADDPSLYLTAAALWDGDRFPGLPRRPDEALLAGLGRAVRLFPLLHMALLEQRPAAMPLTTGEAFEFLRQVAPLLQAAGFGVQLPSWAGRKGVGLKLTTRSKPKSKAGASRAVADSGFGLAELVEFRIDLVIGESTVSAEELAELARLKVPLVRVRGQWVELDDRQLKAALKAVSRRREGELTAGEVLQQVVDGGDEDLPLVEIDADGMLGDLLSGQAAERLTPLPTPAGFHGTLRPYQERGLSWLAFLSRLGLGGILADDMGLGKTAQTLSLLLTENLADPSQKTLLICPMSLVSNWQKEAARFAPSLRVYVHHGGTRLRGDDFTEAVAGADLVLTTYGTALRDLDALREVSWGRVACDEAQAIKNSGTRQSQAVRAIKARTRLALTGTPVENHLAELWSIMDFVNPGLLGPAKRFRRRFQEPIENRQDEDATAALKRATGPFVLRRLKTDKSIISDLPEKNEMKVWCSLTPEQATLYQAVVEDMMAEIENSEGIQRRGNVLAAMMKLKQVCNHPAHLLKDGSRLPGRSGKLARLEELAEEIVEDGDKALVFTQYAEWGTLLQPYLTAQLDRPVLWLHGGLTKARRDELVERFQTGTEPMIFLLSLKAAGTGLNLTAANHVVHFDRWWNPAVEDQATDRAYRIGQSRDVQVRKFICTGTLEEKIDQMIERKKALASSVVGTGEDWVTDLDTDQLRELFSLGPGAVS